MKSNNVVRFVLTVLLFSIILYPSYILATRTINTPKTNTLILESTSPIEGAVNVPVAGPFSFTFNEAIDQSAVYEDFYLGISLHPEETYTDDESIDVSEDGRTITFTGLALREDTQYLVLLTGARSTTGNTLDKPYVLHFSTGQTLGEYTVSGQISSDIGSVENSVVLLAQLDEEGLWMYNGTVVENTQGDYTIPYVQNDDYMLVVGIDSNEDGVIDPFTGDNSGWYDSDMDGWPDDISVASDVNGIDIEMSAAGMTTAGKLEPQANGAIKEIDPTAYLAMIYGEDVTPEGKAPGWYYVYYSPTLNTAASVMTIGQVMMEGGIEEVDVAPNPIPESWLDSDQIMALAEAAGGASFRAAHSDADVSMSLGPEEESEPQNSRIIWRVFYESESKDEYFYAQFDPVTGADLTGIKENPIIQPTQIQLLPNYPNPFNPSTTIDYILPKQGHVGIRILDVRGREVAVLLNSEQTAGWHRVEWNGILKNDQPAPSGSYFCEIKVGEERRLQRLLLLK